MLDGSEHEITGLLDRLRRVVSEGVEMPVPERPEPETVSVAEPPSKEQDEAIITLVNKARTGNQRAIEILKTMYDETVKRILAKKKGATSDLSDEDIEELENEIWKWVFRTGIHSFDPAKGEFGAIIYSGAQTIIDRNLKKLQNKYLSSFVEVPADDEEKAREALKAKGIAPKEVHDQITRFLFIFRDVYEARKAMAAFIDAGITARILPKGRSQVSLDVASPEGEATLGATLAAKEVSGVHEFTPEELELGRELKHYLKRVLDGKEPHPFPIAIRYKYQLPGETAAQTKERIGKVKVDIFMHFYGIGVPRLDAAGIVKKYPEFVPDRIKVRVVTDPIWDGLRRWAQHRGKAEVFKSMEAKIRNMIGVTPGAAPIIEHLVRLAVIVEEWNAEAAVA